MLAPYDPMDNDLPIQPSTWTREYVAWRMIEAQRVLRTQPAEGWPAQYGNNWPHILRTFADAAGAEELREKSKWSYGRARGSSSSIEIALMYQAFDWVLKYLRANEGEARVLNFWAEAKAHPHKKVYKEAAKKDWNERTVRRTRNKALDRIAAGLIRDGVPVS